MQQLSHHDVPLIHFIMYWHAVLSKRQPLSRSSCTESVETHSIPVCTTPKAVDFVHQLQEQSWGAHKAESTRSNSHPIPSPKHIHLSTRILGFHKIKSNSTPHSAPSLINHLRISKARSKVDTVDNLPTGKSSSTRIRGAAEALYCIEYRMTPTDFFIFRLLFSPFARICVPKCCCLTVEIN